MTGAAIVAAVAPFLPARCDSCGHIWTPPGLVSVRNATDISFDEIKIVRGCPQCGGDAHITSGTFDHSPETGLVLTSGPAWSREVFEHLGLALKRIVEEEPADPVAALADVHREAAEALRDTVELLRKENPRKSPRKIALAVMAYLLSTVFAGGVGVAVDRATDGDHSGGQISPEQLQHEFDEQLKRIQNQKKVPRPKRAPRVVAHQRPERLGPQQSPGSH